MSEQPPDAPNMPPGPPPYPGAPPPYPGYPPPPAPPQPQPSASPDPWYTPAPPQGPPLGYPLGGGMPPPSMPPPGQWTPGPSGYGQQPYPGAAPLATYWARVGGFLLDAVIVAALYLVVLLPTHSFHGMTRATANHVGVRAGVSGGATLFILVVGVLYSSLLIGLRGQTIGMMAARIKAIDANTGNLIGFGRALGRDLFERLLGFLLFIPLVIDLLFPAWDPRRQTLHDKVTNTVVIKI